jgi:nucleoside-diphosphate-sugar epimerase
MKALIIGGTGTISSAISRLLIERGWRLYLLNRGSSLAPEGAAGLIKADISDEEAVRGLIGGQEFDVVADFVAYTPDQAERDFRLFRGLTGQYIFISSASAYQKPLANPVITEDTPLVNPYWQYSRDKIACEEALARHLREDGFPITVVRPSHTYDERGVPLALHGRNGSWQILKRMLEGKPVLIHGDGLSRWTFTHNRDFARAFAGIMANPDAIGEAVQITSDESITWNTAYQLIAGALGVKLNGLHVPSSLLAEAGRAAGYLDFEGGLLGDKATSVLFDNSKIKRLVPGFKAEITFAEGVRETVDNMLKSPELQREDPDFDRFCDGVAAVMEEARSRLASLPG